MKILFLFFFVVSSHLLNAQCFPDRHSTDWFDAWVSCQMKISPNAKNPEGHWVLYDLGALYKIDKWKVWNINDPSHLDWGTKKLHVEFSEDSINWMDAGNFTLTKGHGNNRYEGMDWMDLIIPKTRYILLTSETNFKGNCHGFAEVRFSAEKIKLNTDVADPELNSNLFSAFASPNPFSDEVRIEVNSKIPGNYYYQVTSILGEKVIAGNMKMDKSFNHLILNSRTWTSGSYVIVIQKENEVIRLPLIKI
jgi:Secretion system C-terminal sorting domain